MDKIPMTREGYERLEAELKGLLYEGGLELGLGRGP